MKRVVLAFVLLPFLFAALAIVAFLPAWVHVRDDRPRVTVGPAGNVIPNSIELGRTRNVTVIATPRFEAAIVAATSRKMVGSDVGADELVLVPLVEKTWLPGQPVSVVLATPASELQKSDAYATSQAAGAGGVGAPLVTEGEVRNVLWEGGLPAAQRELFAASGAPLTDNVVLITRAGTRTDWLWSYAAAGLAFVLGLLAAEGHRRVWRRRHPRVA